ncbi:hypothetical protein BVI2075_610016 [Burkholderia vietnamiensis]|nr:hypothetical protein BVI2075_610016 [Burkholderia vietnamiensis]
MLRGQAAHRRGARLPAWSAAQSLRYRGQRGMYRIARRPHGREGPHMAVLTRAQAPCLRPR